VQYTTDLIKRQQIVYQKCLLDLQNNKIKSLEELDKCADKMPEASAFNKILVKILNNSPDFIQLYRDLKGE